MLRSCYIGKIVRITSPTTWSDDLAESMVEEAEKLFDDHQRALEVALNRLAVEHGQSPESFKIVIIN